MLYMNSDHVMLGWLRRPADVGQYSVAVRVAESLYFMPMVLSSTFLPRIGSGSGRFESDPESRRLYWSAWLLGVGMVGVPILLLPPHIIFDFG